ncbi:hypothetical protein ABPG75_004297 [Micractinium tetrahymenae]
MAFEMSLPHAPRIQAVGADGAETLAHDEQQWDLYFTVQKALAAQQEGGAADEAGEGEQAETQEAAKAAQPSDPGRVLEKLLTARGELDVICDLVTFVEQQQFLVVAGIHRHPPSLEERVRTRALRLAASKAALRRAAERLAGGAAALRAQEGVENRFLGDLAQLRWRWRLARHAGEAGMFHVDIGLPLWGAAGEGITQEGAQCNIVMDTNGDACIVEAAGAGGTARRAVRGWRHISAVLSAKQRLLAWQALRQMVAAAARQQRHEADPDGAVAAVQRMVAAAAAACQAAVYAAVASGGSSDGDGSAAMEVDAPTGSQKGAGRAAVSVTTPGAATQPLGTASSSSSSDPMLSSAAKDILAAQAAPGFQQQFETRALQLLATLLPGGSASSSGGRGAASGAGTGGASTAHDALLEALLRWLHHAALCHRVQDALGAWAAAAPGRALRRLDSGEESVTVWQLLGCRAPGAAPVLAIAVEDSLRLEGISTAAGAAAAAAATQRGLTRAEFERLLMSL